MKILLAVAMVLNIVFLITIIILMTVKTNHPAIQQNQCPTLEINYMDRYDKSILSWWEGA